MFYLFIFFNKSQNTNEKYVLKFRSNNNIAIAPMLGKDKVNKIIVTQIDHD